MTQKFNCTGIIIMHNAIILIQTIIVYVSKIFVSRRLDLRKEATIELKRAAVVKNIMGGKM